MSTVAKLDHLTLDLLADPAGPGKDVEEEGGVWGQEAEGAVPHPHSVTLIYSLYSLSLASFLTLNCTASSSFSNFKPQLSLSQLACWLSRSLDLVTLQILSKDGTDGLNHHQLLGSVFTLVFKLSTPSYCYLVMSHGQWKVFGQSTNSVGDNDND